MNCYMVLSFRAKQKGKAQARERGNVQRGLVRVCGRACLLA